MQFILTIISSRYVSEFSIQTAISSNLVALFKNEKKKKDKSEILVATVTVSTTFTYSTNNR